MSYHPDPLSTLLGLIDDAFTARAGNGGEIQKNQAPAIARPKLDLHEDEKANLVTAVFELPGLTKQDVNIEVANGVLTVSGETKVSQDKDEKGWLVRERRFGKFSRSLQLPQGIKPEEIKASMDHGVLTVTFPRTTPEQAPKKIAVN